MEPSRDSIMIVMLCEEQSNLVISETKIVKSISSTLLGKKYQMKAKWENKSFIKSSKNDKYRNNMTIKPIII